MPNLFVVKNTEPSLFKCAFRIPRTRANADTRLANKPDGEETPSELSRILSGGFGVPGPTSDSRGFDMF